MKIADKDTKAVDLVRAALEKAKEYEDYHAFISMNEARALERAREIDAKIEKGEKVGRLAGVPFALKDNYLSPEGERPIPNPQSPIPNPQSPIPNLIKLNLIILKINNLK